ncbi:MAG TPA: hypothetical protein DDW48_08095, partial [Methyloceanibacter sp.]|nr:hypothetical protein [Methyloceanibacter sp.]
MRGKVLAVRKLLLLPVLALGAVPAAAEDLAASAPEAAVIVLDASKSMNDKVGDKAKMDTVRRALAKTISADA